MNRIDRSASPAKHPQHTRELLDLLDVVDGQESVTQRSLAERIGVAVGLANALVRRAVRKGFIKVSQAPVRRYVYYLTADGFAEKSRLVTEYLSVSLSFFRRARGEYLTLFEYCGKRNWRRVFLAGTGELAEIALLAAREADVDVVGIIDAQVNQPRVMKLPVFRDVSSAPDPDAVIITNSRDAYECYEVLAASISPDRILAPPLLRLRRPSPPEI